MMDRLITQTLTGKGDSDQLAAAIFGIALTTRGSKFLELGVREGASTYPLLLACKYLNAELTSVDIQRNIFNCPDELQPHWKFVQSDALDYLERSPQHYDLIFIDDWHDGLHVKKELELLAPYCNKETVILLHDLMYGWKNPDYNKSDNGGGWGLPNEFANGGPYKAVADLPKDEWEFSTIPFNNGLTILRKIK